MMGRSSGNKRIKVKLPEFLQEIENPNNFTVEEVVTIYEKNLGTVYNHRRIGALLTPYATAHGTKKYRHWRIRDKWRYLFEEENSNS